MSQRLAFPLSRYNFFYKKPRILLLEQASRHIPFWQLKTVMHDVRISRTILGIGSRPKVYQVIQSQLGRTDTIKIGKLSVDFFFDGPVQRQDRCCGQVPCGPYAWSRIRQIGKTLPLLSFTVSLRTIDFDADLEIIQKKLPKNQKHFFFLQEISSQLFNCCSSQKQLFLIFTLCLRAEIA